MFLVVLHEGLAEVEDGRGPKPHEDRRLALAGEVQRQRDQDGDERPAHVDTLSTVQGLPPCWGPLLSTRWPTPPIGRRSLRTPRQGRSSENNPSTHSGE